MSGWSEWNYPEHLHQRALDRLAVIGHAISVLLHDLDSSTTIDARQASAAPAHQSPNVCAPSPVTRIAEAARAAGL